MKKKDILALPIIEQGQADDLISEYVSRNPKGKPIFCRVWRSRMSLSDGETHLLTLESRLPFGEWKTTGKYKKLFTN